MLIFLVACAGSNALDTAGDVPSASGAYEPADTCPPPTSGLPYLRPVAPNVMLVVDRSGSMEEHWGNLLHLTPYIEAMGDLTRTGLAYFPDDGYCGVEDSIEIPIAEGTAGDIMQSINSNHPAGGTPLSQVLDHLREHGRLQDPYRDNVLILVGDGQPTCDGDIASAIDAAAEWAGLEVSVKMHFIGFDAGAANDTFSDMAAAAGEGFHYEADNITDLLDRLGRVAASLDACGYALDEPVDAVTVSIEGQDIAACQDADCVEGFFYDPDAGIVTLAAQTCREAALVDCPEVVIQEAG